MKDGVVKHPLVILYMVAALLQGCTMTITYDEKERNVPFLCDDYVQLEDRWECQVPADNGDDSGH